MKPEYRAMIEAGLQTPDAPESLYAPAKYFLALPAKRIRPVLTLAVYEALTGKAPLPALNAALAVEMFHNFTLVHDDVMDNADLRRGQATVHRRHGLNTAILCGDAMHVLAYRFLKSYDDPVRSQLTFMLLDTALEVCEGQARDLCAPPDVEGYMAMLEQKTGALLGTAAAMGAVVARADEATVQKINVFARHWGTAFQIIDDVLDMYGGAEFGKQPGGDVVEGKKTVLWYAAYENLSLRNALDEAWSRRNVEEMRKLFDAANAPTVARHWAARRFEFARQAVADVPEVGSVVRWLDSLAERTV